jgi:hypothetical protein
MRGSYHERRNALAAVGAIGDRAKPGNFQLRSG